MALRANLSLQPIQAGSAGRSAEFKRWTHVTKRRIEAHEECLKSFAQALKREIKENLTAWETMDREQAIGRRMAFSNVVFALKREAEKHGIPLVDLGLVDYEVPRIDRQA
jgi:hypothetical protein